MANSFQRASTRRKLIYFGTIVALFVVTVFVRGLVAMPSAELKRATIQEQADRLDLNELNQGDVELTGSAVRLLLTGSRGLAICGLWMSANEKQVRHEWNELELIVKSITKLQPHFVTPWLFQSWNLTYNVSVEMDRLNDMYFYIGRGISLLSEGESINRNNPDMRYAIAFYYQNKFTVSDKVTTLRCLFQLSCMTKDERDPQSLLKGGQIDMEAYKAFCEKNPQLVRRLRETPIRLGKGPDGNELRPFYLCSTPADIVQFLKENLVLPNRFRDDSPKVLEDRLKQFPVLPPPFYRRAEEELNPERPISDGESSAVRAARVWFRYANEVIPPPNPEPSYSPDNYRDPERKRRVPRQPMLIIFRQGPPRAQTFIADQLAKEGWFDRDPWIVDDKRDGGDRWFKENVAIKPTANSQEEWEIAHRMWADHGRANGLNFEPFQIDSYRQRAAIYARLRGFTIGENMPEPRADERNDPIIADSIKANMTLRIYQSNLRVTNYEYFLYQAEAEKDSDTIRARKFFFEAESESRRQHISTAIALYEKVLGTQQKIGLWGEVLLKKDRFRTATDKILEDTYEQQINYLRMVRETKQPELRRASLALFDIMRTSGSPSPYTIAFNELYLQGIAYKESQEDELIGRLKSVEPIWPPGPFDGVDPKNQLWIPEHVKERTRNAMGLFRAKAPAAPAPKAATQASPPLQ